MCRADRALEASRPQAKVTVEVGVQHDDSYKQQYESSVKLQEETQQRLQRLRPSAAQLQV